jgi:DnaJ-class molecular chaperone
MEGWTGKDCPNCEGRGTVLDDYGHEVTCDACDGTGHEWGEISDEPDGWSPLTAKKEAARVNRRPLKGKLTTGTSL